MEVLTVEQLKQLGVQFSVAIGFFDGVHLGHQLVIKKAIKKAAEFSQKSLVITFDRSPKIAMGIAQDDGYLTPTKQKLNYFEKLGVDYTLVLPFEQELIKLSADDFITQYLTVINTKFVTVGFDFQFGNRGSGTTTTLMNNTAFKTEVIEAVEVEHQKVATTKIKSLLRAGNLEAAAQMLGRYFIVGGTVVAGKKLGRTIGFPTANVAIGSEFYQGLNGVYVTRFSIKDQTYYAMTNIGINPTVNDAGHTTVETHIFDFSKDIYGEYVKIEFLTKIREEKKFDSIDELVMQLKDDMNFAKTWIK